MKTEAVSRWEDMEAINTLRIEGNAALQFAVRGSHHDGERALPLLLRER